MFDERIRRVVAIEAAKLMYEGQEREYFTAKRKVARRHGVDPRHAPGHLPSNREIREEILRLAELLEGDTRRARLGAMRRAALWVLRLLRRFDPKLIGSVCTGHIRDGSDIDVHVFSDSVGAVTLALDEERLECAVERKRVVKHGVSREFVHVHATVEGHEVELTVYPAAKRTYPFRSSITGDVIESLTLPELEQLVAREHPAPTGEADGRPFRRARLRLLLEPLARLAGGPHHPEGDPLYHSLQVFDLARCEAPYDLELAEAALLHDVGKAIDRAEHAEAGAAALGDLVSDRVRWLVAHHMEALALVSGKLGRRRARRLRADPRFDELMTLRRLDTAGRRPGVAVPSLDEALDVLERGDGGWEDDDPAAGG